MLSIAVGAGGMIGACLRYYLGIIVHGWWVFPFPLGTLIANLTGSFALGGLTAWFEQNSRIPVWFRVGFSTGVIGSFTTFSTFSVESFELAQLHLWVQALLYITLSLLGGLLMVGLGYRTISPRGQRRHLS